MVVLIAPPGSGKTRIVQEFYRELAARQPAPAYWPPSLVEDDADNGLKLSDLTSGRKTVRHRTRIAPPEGSVIPWLWLAPAAGRLSDGSAAPALNSVTAQLREHLDSLPGRAASRDDFAPTSRLSSLLRGPDGARLPVILVLDDAHELDAATTDFVSDVLASDIPALIVATTWPEKLGPTPSGAFAVYLANAATSSRLTLRVLGQLSREDLISYVLDQFPETDQQVAVGFAERADHNPYALRLLLNTPRVSASIRHGVIRMDAEEVRDLNGRLEALLAEHWAELPVGVRQVLVAAALMGQSFLDEVLEAGLRRLHPQAGLDDAIASSWIRPLGGSGRIVEFVERMRYEIAHSDAPNFLSARERAEVYHGALRALRRILPEEPEGTGRVVLQALHVRLAKEGVEEDLAAAAVSATDLAERARPEYRRLDVLEYLSLAIDWSERAHPVPVEDLIKRLITYSKVTELQYDKARSEPTAVRAVELADQHLAPQNETRIHALLRLARARRRRHSPEAFASFLELTEQINRLMDRCPDASPELRHDAWSFEVGNRQVEVEYPEAARLAAELARFCEDAFGPVDVRTLEALGDHAYSLQRYDTEGALVARRDLLARRLRRFDDPMHLQAAGAKGNVAFSLLETRDPAHHPEVERLCAEAIVSRSRGFGFDGPSTRNIRLIRARLWMAQGLLAEQNDDPARAAELFDRAAAETARVVELRRESIPGALAIALLRLGEALACQRDPRAIEAFDDALDLRENQLQQGHTHPHVITCAKSLWWAYRRLGREAEAASLVRRYDPDKTLTSWAPTVEPLRVPKSAAQAPPA